MRTAPATVPSPSRYRFRRAMLATTSSADPGPGRLLARSVRSGAVVIIDLLAARTVGPIPALVLGIFRRAVELLLADVDFVALEPRVVRQKRPRQGVVVLAESEETAEAHDRIGGLAADRV